ncbi:MAG: OstA-like protein [Cytophagales bacterium]|nr:OstA-like protein [Cytophagales bacterium]
MNKYVIFALFFIYFNINALSQEKQKIELIRAGSLEGTYYMGQPIRKLTNDVMFRHSGATMYCDSSYQYEAKNDIEAFGNIKVIKSDTQSIKGSYMNYYGDLKLAKITGPDVVLKNGTVTLYTTILDYDLQNDVSHYYNKGKVIDKENILISDIGTYYKNKSEFVFVKNVKFTDQKHTIYTDTLYYYTETKIIKFRGPTTITGTEGNMHALAGEYDSNNKTSHFTGRAHINYGDFAMSADKIKYNQTTKAGIGLGNVEIFSKKDSVYIFGDIAQYRGTDSKTKVYNHTLLKSIHGTDTLYLTSDTLYAVNDTIAKNKKFIAYHKVKIFNKMMQAIADSLVFDMLDSTMTFFKDPVLWNNKNQSRGDTIKLYTKKGKVDWVKFRKKAYMISQDTVQNYNQVKGDNIHIKFVNNKIQKVDVSGSAESIYYVLADEVLTTGLNKAKCSNISVKFEEQKVKTITFYKKPEAEFIPLHEITDEKTRLRGFKWRAAERPDRPAVMGKYYIP